MNNKTRSWLHGLIAAFVGGGASAITSGLTSMGFAPDKFNMSDSKGFAHLLEIMAANFIVSGFLSIAFYLRQSPLPPESTGNTDIFPKPPEP